MHFKVDILSIVYTYIVRVSCTFRLTLRNSSFCIKTKNTYDSPHKTLHCSMPLHYYLFSSVFLAQVPSLNTEYTPIMTHCLYVVTIALTLTFESTTLSELLTNKVLLFSSLFLI